MPHLTTQGLLLNSSGIHCCCDTIITCIHCPGLLSITVSFSWNFTVIAGGNKGIPDWSCNGSKTSFLEFQIAGGGICHYRELPAPPTFQLCSAGSCDDPFVDFSVLDGQSLLRLWFSQAEEPFDELTLACNFYNFVPVGGVNFCPIVTPVTAFDDDLGAPFIQICDRLHVIDPAESIIEHDPTLYQVTDVTYDDD